MKNLLGFALTSALLFSGFAASAQTPSRQTQWWKLNHGSISVGGTGQFTSELTSDPQTVPTIYNNSDVAAFGQQQKTTWSAGFLTSLQLAPRSWAGFQINYGFSHYQERYAYNLSNVAGSQYYAVPTDWHEATAGYLIHPKHIPFQPYVVIGGGAIGFRPDGNAFNHLDVTYGQPQWRGAGLLEAGFDLPTNNKHIGFRISGRSLYYRAPNFGNSTISTHSWRVTTEPAVSAYYKF
ncbi:MAG: hypothetical protein PW735_06610 [Acidobacteriaceae bacterium]|nr:hypothetical protein [Acidobacteriaceae bacterium]